MLHLGFARLPAGAAELVERDTVALAKAGEKFDVFDRQIQLLEAVVDQAQAVVRSGSDAQCFEPVVASDAVFLMDDQVALGDLGGFGDELVGALAAARRAADSLAEQILLPDDGDVAGHEAAFEPERDDGRRLDREFERLGPGVDRLDRDVVLAQQVGDAFARAAGPGGDDGAAFLGRGSGGLGFELGEDGLADPGAGLGEDRAGAATGVQARRAVGLAIGAEHRTRPHRQHLVPLGAVEIQALLRERTIGDFAVAAGRAPGFLVVGDHVDARFEHFGRLVIEADESVVRVVEQRLHGLMEQRRPVLDPGVTPAFGHGLIQRVVGRGGAEQVAPGFPETGDAGLVVRHFGDWA